MNLNFSSSIYNQSLNTVWLILTNTCCMIICSCSVLYVDRMIDPFVKEKKEEI